ncbi:MAG: hypothetical protein LUH36_07180 [Oscillospiraceae bacterium]|nr:hypothetical protein [Oscillospiraceae bacterium]
MTYGELITRLCQLRDEMNKTEQGRMCLGNVVATLKYNPERYMEGNNDGMD